MFSFKHLHVCLCDIYSALSRGVKNQLLQDGVDPSMHWASPLSIQSHQFGHVVADPSLEHRAVLIGLPAGGHEEADRHQLHTLLQQLCVIHTS